MDLPFLSAAVLGLAALSFTGGETASLQSASAASKAQGAEALVGRSLLGSEEPIALWDGPLRTEDLALEDLGTVAAVRTDPEGRAEGLVVTVGGLWGYGAQEVEMGMERVRLVRGADGQDHLVLDLSSSGAEPPIDGADL